MATMINSMNPIYSSRAGVVDSPQGRMYNLDTDKDIPASGAFGAAANRDKLEKAFGSIDGIYNDLIKEGKRSQAFALRDASDKFRRAGSKYGVNSFRRARALKDLEGSLNIASRGANARLMQQKLADIRSTIGQLSQMSNTSFSQAMQKADFRERKLKGVNQMIGNPITRVRPQRRSTGAANAMRYRNKMNRNSGVSDARWAQFRADSDAMRKKETMRKYMDEQAHGNILRTGHGSPIVNSVTSGDMAYYGGGQTGVARQMAPTRPITLPVSPNANPVTGGMNPQQQFQMQRQKQQYNADMAQAYGNPTLNAMKAYRNPLR